MIPIQEQLIESKNGTWKAASEMAVNASQPFFVMANQRTAAFLDLTQAIVEYNKMIAEYALEIIPSNVSQQQLVAAVVRTPRDHAVPGQPQFSQTATENIQRTSPEAPVGIPAQPISQVAYEYQPALTSGIAPATWTTPAQEEESIESSAPEWETSESGTGESAPETSTFLRGLVLPE
jgi:hypothetical protein